MKKLILFILLFATSAFAKEEIDFLRPANGEKISGELTIEIKPLRHIRSYQVYIEQDFGWHKMVWRGTLTKDNDFKTTVDISKYEKGKYKIKAEFQGRGGLMDGHIDFEAE